MRWEPHVIIGAAAGLAYAGGKIDEHTAPWILAAAAAALGPDLDHPHSRGSQIIMLVGTLATLGTAAFVGTQVFLDVGFRWSVIVATIGSFVLLQILLQRLMPSNFFEHRGLLHAPIVAPAVALAVQLLSHDENLARAVLFGWLSHLAADLPTRGGLPLGRPFFTAPEHRHRRTVKRGRRMVDDLYTCKMFHLTPWWSRWHSGTQLIEFPLAVGFLGWVVIGMPIPLR